MLRQRYLWLITALLLIPLTFYLYATIFVRYIADDYCEAVQAHQLGPLGMTDTLYQGWTGRWAFALASAVAKLTSSGFVGLPTVLLIISWWIVIILVIRIVVFQLQLPRSYAYAGGTLLLLAIFGAAPDPIQSFYWQAGLLTHAVPLLIFCILIWIVFAQRDHPVIYIVCGFLTVVVAGLSDTMGIVDILVLPLIAYLFPDQRRRSVAAWIGALIGFIIVFIAPGNAVRRSFSPPPDLNLSIVFTLRALGLPFADAVRHAPVATFALLFLTGYVAYQSNIMLNPVQRRQIKSKLLAILLGVIAINGACLFTSYYVLSALLPPRARLILVFFTLIGLAVVVYFSVLLIRHRTRYHRVLHFGILAIIIVVAITASADAGKLADDLRGYAMVSDAREAVVRSGSSQFYSLQAFGLEDMRDCTQQFYALK